MQTYVDLKSSVDHVGRTQAKCIYNMSERIISTVDLKGSHSSTIWLWAAGWCSSGWSGCSGRSCQRATPVWSSSFLSFGPSCSLPPAPPLHHHRPPRSPRRCAHHAPPVKKRLKLLSAEWTLINFAFVFNVLVYVHRVQISHVLTTHLVALSRKTRRNKPTLLI